MLAESFRGCARSASSSRPRQYLLLDLFDLLLAQAEVVADLVDQRFADRRRSGRLRPRPRVRAGPGRAGCDRAACCRMPTAARSAASPDTGRTAYRAARSPSRRAGRPTARLRRRWRCSTSRRETGAGIVASASATSRSNALRVIAGAGPVSAAAAAVSRARRFAAFRPAFARLGAPADPRRRHRSGNTRSRPARRTRSQSGFGRQMRRPCRMSVSDVRVQRAGGSAAPSCCLDDFRIVGLGDADAVRDAQHVAIDRQARDAQRMAQHDVGGLAADARQRGQRVHVGRHLRRRAARPAPAPSR